MRGDSIAVDIHVSGDGPVDPGELGDDGLRVKAKRVLKESRFLCCRWLCGALVAGPCLKKGDAAPISCRRNASSLKLHIGGSHEIV